MSDKKFHYTGRPRLGGLQLVFLGADAAGKALDYSNRDPGERRVRERVCHLHKLPSRAFLDGPGARVKKNEIRGECYIRLPGEAPVPVSRVTMTSFEIA